MKELSTAAQCHVSVADYVRYWNTTAVLTEAPTMPYSGPERRVGVTDRRTANHERRWQASAGRRFRLADRRKAS